MTDEQILNMALDCKGLLFTTAINKMKEPGVKLYAAHILEMEVRLNTVDKFRGAEEPEQLNREEGK